MAAFAQAGVDTATARLQLLVLQPTPFCNIDCAYCYLSNRRSTARMSLETLDLACRRVFESPFLDRQLQVAWHGGEPLVVPLAWYEDAVALMAERRPATLHLTHCFQTNGLLLNEDWVRFFVRTGARLGLSIDGPADLHDANRRTRRGRGTHDGAVRAVRLLQEQDVPFHVITVLTERALDDPDRLFDFYVQNGISDVGFNVEEVEGANTASSLADRGETKFPNFIRRWPLVCEFGQHWLARAVSFNPTTRRLALSARPLQKPFACRDQFTATHQFDVGVYLRGDTERVRISVAAQHLPVIQPQCSAIK
jgi:sulfatase maturation enzyme AslB (radical SAM superfamily)